MAGGHLAKKARPSTRTFYFRQPVPIPSYLLALAVSFELFFFLSFLFGTVS